MKPRDCLQPGEARQRQILPKRALTQRVKSEASY
jgi:hypothetical protein